MAEDRRTSERVPLCCECIRGFPRCGYRASPAGRCGAAALHLLQTQQEPRYGGSTMQPFPQCVDNLSLCGFAPKPGSDGARAALGCAAHEVAAEAAARAALPGAVSCGRAGGGGLGARGGRGRAGSCGRLRGSEPGCLLPRRFATASQSS